MALAAAVTVESSTVSKVIGVTSFFLLFCFLFREFPSFIFFLFHHAAGDDAGDRRPHRLAEGV